MQTGVAPETVILEQYFLAPFYRLFDSSTVSILNIHRRDPWAIILLFTFIFLIWGSGGCRSHGEGGAFEREVIVRRKRDPTSRFLLNIEGSFE